MKSTTEKAATICKKVTSPSGATVETLAKLFRSSTAGSSSKGSRKRSFDPKSECVVASQQSKKKATNQRMKPKVVTVVLLCQKPDCVPKGHSRKKLKLSGRIQKIQFMRCMKTSEVRETIVNSFSGFNNVETAQFLRCGKDNIMVLNEEQDLDGELLINLAGQGSLYLTQKRVDVSIIIIALSHSIVCSCVPLCASKREQGYNYMHDYCSVLRH